MLEIKNVSKKIFNKDIINNFNLTVEDNTILGLFGPNGSGKSTLLRMLSNVYDINEGKILLDDIDISSIDAKKIILFLPDDFPFYDFKNAFCIFDFYSSFYSIDREKFMYYLNSFGVNSTSSLNSLSKGNKNKILLSLALAVGPKMLLIDECFDGIDTAGREFFKKELEKLMKVNQMIVIITSHLLKELEDIIDQYIIIQNGKIAYQGCIDLPNVDI